MRRWIAGVITTLTVLGALCACASSGSDQMADEPGQQVASPSGDFVATLEEDGESGGVTLLRPVITDRDGEVVFTDQRNHSERHGVSLTWVEDDVLWIFSSDRGTVRVEQQGDTWAPIDDPGPPPTIQP